MKHALKTAHVLTSNSACNMLAACAVDHPPFPTAIAQTQPLEDL